MLIDDFNHTIGIYIQALKDYSFGQICWKPSASSWSIGQMYMHLIEDGGFYIEQIKICIASNDHSMEDASVEGRRMLRENAFPDEIIKGSPSNVFIPQPVSKDQLMMDLLNFRDEMNAVANIVFDTTFRGKSKHPGLGYFTAKEWIQFANMHLCHHLKQKNRLDDSLKLLRDQSST